MSVRSLRLAGALLALGTVSARAQGPVGTVGFQMVIALPDSITAKIPGGSSGPMKMAIVLAADGKRVAADLSLTGGGSPMLAGMHLKGVFDPSSDTVHVALLMPDLTGSGTPSGYKLDLPKSMFAGMSGMMDSAMKNAMDSVSRTLKDSIAAHPTTYQALGTTATYAGLACEEWRAMTRDDTLHMCVVPTSPAFQEFRDQLLTSTGMKKFTDQIMGITARVPKPFNGRDMMMIHMTDSKSGMSMELTQISSALPSPAVFTLPANLMPAPFAMPGKGVGSLER